MKAKLSNHRLMVKELIHVRLRLFEFALFHSLEELLQKTLDELGD